MRAPPSIVCDVRFYSAEDQTEVVDLLTAALGEGPVGMRSSEFFSWKHLDNPLGRSYMLVGTVEDHIVRFRSFMRGSLRVKLGTAARNRALKLFDEKRVTSTVVTHSTEQLRRKGLIWGSVVPPQDSLISLKPQETPR
jgi:hypothetical protein